MEHHLDLPPKHGDLVGSLALSSISTQKSTSHFPQSALAALTFLLHVVRAAALPHCSDQEIIIFCGFKSYSTQEISCICKLHDSTLLSCPL